MRERKNEEAGKDCDENGGVAELGNLKSLEGRFRGHQIGRW